MNYLFILIYICKDLILNSVVGIEPNKIEGFYTDGLENVEIVVPKKVLEDGTFVSNYLPHYYDVSSRPKRDSSNAIHFTVPINGKKQQLELWPQYKFLSPGLVIERRDNNAVEDISNAKFKKLPKNQCYYSGQVIGQPNSKVALSTCNGLVGYIKLPNEEYLIEPIKDSRPSLDKEHAHFIYKRSDQTQSTKSNCGTKGSAKAAFIERMEWEALTSNKNSEDLDTLISSMSNPKVSERNLSAENKTLDIKQTIGLHSNSRSNQFSTLNQELDNEYKFPAENNQPTKFLNKDDSFYNDYKRKKQNSIHNNQINKFYLKTDNLQKERNEEKVRRKRSTSNINITASDINDIEQNDMKSDREVKEPESGLNKIPEEPIQNEQTVLNVDYDSILNVKDKRSTNGSSGFISENMRNIDESRLQPDQSQQNSESSDSLFYNNLNDENDIDIPELSLSMDSSLAVDDKKASNMKINGTESLKSNETKSDKNSVTNSKKQNIGHYEQNITATAQKNENENETSNLNTLASSNINESATMRQSKNVSVTDKGGKLNASNISNNTKDIGKAKEKTDNNKQIPSKLNSINGSTNNMENITTKTIEEKNMIEKETENKFNFGNASNKETIVAMNTTGGKSELDMQSHLKLVSNITNSDNNQDEELNDDSPIEAPCVVDGDQNVQIDTNIKLENNQDINSDDNYAAKKEDVNGKGEKKFIDDVEVIEEDNNKENIEYGSSNNINEDKVQEQRSTGYKMLKPVWERDGSSSSESNPMSYNFNLEGSEKKDPKENKFHFNNRHELQKIDFNDPHNYIRKNNPARTKPEDEENINSGEFFSKQYTIELMVTVDQKVMELHAEDDIEIFILTVVNMVASNFYDASMGIEVNVALVHLILLSNRIKQLDVDLYTPTQVLENFCVWQNQINPTSDTHPNHHDLAIFVTRIEQCEGEMLGLSYMTSLCRPDKSCIVCVDKGLLLANIMTHQIGHSLGAEHDEGQNNGCPDSEPDGTSYHMRPNIKQTSNRWTVCSRESIIQFIKSQSSLCLDDLPSDHNFDFPLMLPGQIYSVAQQCKLNFQMYAIPCTIGKFCERLYCQISATECVTRGDPPADGTFCAADMWCFNKDCVAMGRRPGAINGEWGNWSEWTQCTRTCGGGVQKSYRLCNNPKPYKGGRYCVGKHLRHRMCSTNACQGFTQSFRDLQCMKTEEAPYRSHFHNWQRFDGAFNNIECSLVCQNKVGDVVMRAPIAVDGTPCKAGTRNVCIEGTCVNVGCDWVIESNAKEDSCGICHGNGTGCRVITGMFDEASVPKSIVPFLQLPAGSGMIYVREINPSHNLIAVSGALNRVFYLNGEGRHDDATPGDMVFGATHGTYEIRSNMERIFIRGPTTEPLIFHAVFNDMNTGIRYQYAVPEFDPTYIARYQWQYLDWDRCSDPCSGGTQRSRAKCVEDKGGVVDDTYCMVNGRPKDVIRSCNEFPCQAKWWVSIWSDCICSGSVSMMFRSVFCMRSRDEDATRAEIVKDSECTDEAKPRTTKPCNETDFPALCFKRSIESGHPYESNSSHMNLRPYRSITPKLFSIKNTHQKKKSGENLSSNLSSRETANVSLPKVPLRNRSSFNNQNNNKPPTFFNLKNNQIPPRTFDKMKGAADKLQKHMFSNGLPNRKQDLMNKGLNIFQNGRFGENTPQNPNLMLQKHKLQLNPNNKSNNTKLFKKKNEDEENAEPESVEHENTKVTICFENTEPMKEQSTPCETAAPSTPRTTTCHVTRRIVPHRKTTCCKKLKFSIPKATTIMTSTEKPLKARIDEINLNKYGLTIIPEFPPNRKLPQTDEEFAKFGAIGLYPIGSQSNGTMVVGQDAVDFLEKSRDNSTKPPIVENEDIEKI